MIYFTAGFPRRNKGFTQCFGRWLEPEFEGVTLAILEAALFKPSYLYRVSKGTLYLISGWVGTTAPTTP
jgi:hypothetical protein